MRKINDMISIVIPCYNSDKYISRCLDSVVNQKYNNIEIIIVNDGSTDSSLDIIKKYHDDRIKIINKKNEGSWKARIDGIKHSSGKYITFVDSDDVVTNTFVEKLYNNLIENDSDISVCGFDRISSTTNNVLSNEMISYSDSIKIRECMNRIPLINTSNWNKLYKMELFNGIDNYIVTSRTCEDLVLNLIAYFNSNSISFVPEVLYHYYVNDNSIINTLSYKDINSVEKTFIDIREFASKKCTDFLPCIDFMAVIHLGISLSSRIYQSKDKKRKKLIKDICRSVKDNHPLYNKFKTKNIKLIIIKRVFNMNLTYLFILVYSCVINTFKIEIKW